MTEQQRNWIKDIWDNEISRMQGAELIFPYWEGISIVRMEYIPDRRHYRMTSIGSGNDRAEIRRRMIDVFEKVLEDAGARK